MTIFFAVHLKKMAGFKYKIHFLSSSLSSSLSLFFFCPFYPFLSVLCPFHHLTVYYKNIPFIIVFISECLHSTTSLFHPHLLLVSSLNCILEMNFMYFVFLPYFFFKILVQSSCFPSICLFKRYRMLDKWKIKLNYVKSP